MHVTNKLRIFGAMAALSTMAAMQVCATHAFSGPARYGYFADAGKPMEEQWGFHAVAAAMRGHSLLASQPGVDASRIGLTSISWSGVLAGIVAGVDPRMAPEIYAFMGLPFSG